MLRVTADNVDQKRTLRPLYAQHQATPHGGFLDPAWDRSVDIYPGMVMTRITTELFSLFNGAASSKPYGLAALFVAPVLGIDEVRASGTNLFTVWRGGPDAMFEILAPAFDTTAAWTNPTNGSKVGLGVTHTAHSQGPGKLSILGGSNMGTDRVATLIDYVGPTKIIIQLDVQS